MGLRDIFRKLKKGHDTSPYSSHTDVTKIPQPSPPSQQQQQQQKQDKSGLTALDISLTM
jgi:hypothetical protein